MTLKYDTCFGVKSAQPTERQRLLTDDVIETEIKKQIHSSGFVSVVKGVYHFVSLLQSEEISVNK